MIRIIVCAKQVPDPEAPFTAVEVDSVEKKITTKGVAPVINPFDQNAIEAALRIKDQLKDVEIKVLSVGSTLSAAILRGALAVDADDLILVDSPELKNLEGDSVAYALAKAIETIGDYDLILAGRQGGDWDSGQTGLLLGELLGIPTVNLARSVKVEDGKVLVEKIIPGGYELVRAEMPALITVSSEVGELRYPVLKRRMLAYKQPITVWSIEDVEIEPEKLAGIELVELLPPPDMGRECLFIEGDSPEEKGEKLAAILKGGERG
jgi:electron transfer flavoprotein beta subunit